jgi:hypothetical protein
MYIGSDGPRRLLFFAPDNEPSAKPTLDLLTDYIFEALATAAIGHVIDVGGWADFNEKAKAGPDVLCTCGHSEAGLEFYVKDINLYTWILSPLALHFLIWHRDEVPDWMLSRVQDAAETHLADKVRPRAPAPPAFAARLRAMEQAQAIQILTLTLQRLRQRARSTDLLGVFALITTEVGVQWIGWSCTYPRRRATIALYSQTHPENNTDLADEYMAQLINEWAGADDRTLAQVLDALKQAIQSLGS